MSQVGGEECLQFNLDGETKGLHPPLYDDRSYPHLLRRCTVHFYSVRLLPDLSALHSFKNNHDIHEMKLIYLICTRERSKPSNDSRKYACPAFGASAKVTRNDEFVGALIIVIAPFLPIEQVGEGIS